MQTTSVTCCVLFCVQQVFFCGRLRFPDEFVRHKLLDAIGDLSLAGAPIVGRAPALPPGGARLVAYAAAAPSVRSST